MQIEMLHVTEGDKRKKLDTPEETEAFVNIQIRRGTALFLERSGKTYRVKGYDPRTDSLRIVAEVHGEAREVRASGRKSNVVGVPPVAGG